MFIQLPGTETWINLMHVNLLKPGKPSGIGGARETLIWFQNQPEPLATMATIEEILATLEEVDDD